MEVDALIYFLNQRIMSHQMILNPKKITIKLNKIILQHVIEVGSSTDTTIATETNYNMANNDINLEITGTSDQRKRKEKKKLRSESVVHEDNVAKYKEGKEGDIFPDDEMEWLNKSVDRRDSYFQTSFLDLLKEDTTLTLQAIIELNNDAELNENQEDLNVENKTEIVENESVITNTINNKEVSISKPLLGSEKISSQHATDISLTTKEKYTEENAKDKETFKEKKIVDLADYYCLLYKDELEEFLENEKEDTISDKEKKENTTKEENKENMSNGEQKETSIFDVSKPNNVEKVETSDEENDDILSDEEWPSIRFERRGSYFQTTYVEEEEDRYKFIHTTILGP